MPWSPIPKFPEIIRNIKGMGYRKETSFEVIRVCVMRVTNLIKDTTIKQTIKAMEDLGYIKMRSNGLVWEICQEKPYKFDSDNGEEEAKINEIMKLKGS